MFLKITENVTVHPANHVSRDAYSYHFQISEDDWKRWCYNPLYRPEIERHIDLPGEPHVPDRRWTLKEVAEECWEMHAAHLDESGELDD